MRDRAGTDAACAQMEGLERAQHSRGERMRARAEQTSDLRRRNQALVHNVLPPHVARHFMGARHHHRDLYSQSYAEVGVLFASMPNFTGFTKYLLLPMFTLLAHSHNKMCSMETLSL